MGALFWGEILDSLLSPNSVGKKKISGPSATELKRGERKKYDKDEKSFEKRKLDLGIRNYKAKNPALAMHSSLYFISGSIELGHKQMRLSQSAVDSNSSFNIILVTELMYA